MYLNVSEMGKGVFGIDAAAKYYFNKPAKNLTRIESAMIAGCLPNPKILYHQTAIQTCSDAISMDNVSDASFAGR